MTIRCKLGLGIATCFMHVFVYSDTIPIKRFGCKIGDNLRQPPQYHLPAVGTVQTLIKSQVLLSVIQPYSLDERRPAAVSPSPFILITFSSIVPSD